MWQMKRAIGWAIGWGISIVLIPAIVVVLGWLKFWDWLENKVRPKPKRKFNQ